MGAFVNFGADYLAPGRIFARQSGHVPDRRARRPRQRAGGAAGRPTSRTPRRPATCSGSCGRSRRTGRCCSRPRSATSRSPTRWPTPAYRPVFVAHRRARCWTPRRSGRSRSTASTRPTSRARSSGWSSSTGRSAKTHSGIYRDLAVRRRKTEVDAMLGIVDRPLVRRTAELIQAIEGGRRTCERANLDLLAAYERLERLGRPLNAVIAVDRRARPGGSTDRWPVSLSPSRTTSTSAGSVTTNASAVGVPPPAGRDAQVVAPAARGRVPSSSARPTCSSTPRAASARPMV